jgi:hypothetical protein
MLAVILAGAGTKIGGDGWESNPPRTPQQRPANGFEDRGGHQPSIIPSARNRIPSALALTRGVNFHTKGMAPGDETYLDEPYLSIRWHGTQQILYAEWKGFATSAEFRAALLTGVRAIREQHVLGYVSDARKAKVILPEDEQWAREVWLPQAVAAGLRRMAVVTAVAGLAKVEYDDAATDMDSHGLSMRTFDSVAAATVWAQSGLTQPDSRAKS